MNERPRRVTNLGEVLRRCDRCDADPTIPALVGHWWVCLCPMRTSVRVDKPEGLEVYTRRTWSDPMEEVCELETHQIPWKFLVAVEPIEEDA